MSSLSSSSFQVEEKNDELERPKPCIPIQISKLGGNANVGNETIYSDNTAGVAGKVIKDLRKTAERRLRMTGTRQMMTRLLRSEIGTNDVEVEAIKLVKERSARLGRKFKKSSDEKGKWLTVWSSPLMKITNDRIMI